MMSLEVVVSNTWFFLKSGCERIEYKECVDVTW